MCNILLLNVLTFSITRRNGFIRTEPDEAYISRQNGCQNNPNTSGSEADILPGSTQRNNNNSNVMQTSQSSMNSQTRGHNFSSRLSQVRDHLY